MNEKHRAFFTDLMRLCEKHGVEMHATMCTEIRFGFADGGWHHAYSVSERMVWVRGKNVLDRRYVEEMEAHDAE